MRGKFWLADEPDTRLHGEIDFQTGSVTLQGGEELIACQAIVDATEHDVIIEPLSDTNRQYLIHGSSTDGRKVTLLHANRGDCRHTTKGVTQEFLFLVALEGDHVDQSECYQAAEFSFAHPAATWLPEISPRTLTLPELGNVDFRVDEHITYGALPNLTLERVERFVVNPLRILLVLIFRKMLSVDRLVLHRESRPSVTVRRKGGPHSSTSTAVRPLVYYSALAPDGLAKWYEISRKLAPLTSVAAKSIIETYDVELKVLTLAASAEAIHRELHDHRSLTRAQAKEIRAIASAAVPEDVRDRVYEFLSQIGSMTYAERLRELCDTLGGFGDEIAGKTNPTLTDGMVSEGGSPRDLWVDAVKSARNGFAHLLPTAPDDIATYAGRMFVLYESLRWFITFVLLEDIVAEPEAITAGIKSQSAYHLFRDRAVHYWPGIYGAASAPSADTP